MNIYEAQRMVERQNMLNAALPPESEFRELLNSFAESIVTQGRQLVPGPSSFTIREPTDNVFRITRQANPAIELLARFRSAASVLGNKCRGYAPGKPQDVLVAVQDAEQCLDAFTAAAPAMQAAYYCGPIRNALERIRNEVEPVAKAGGKR